jgi:hypothetical protein
MAYIWPTYAEAMRRYSEQAREAANAPTARYLCRECDYQWVSSDPVCEMCERVTPRQVGSVSLFDPIHVEKPNNLGMPHTGFEALGLG